MHQIRVAGYLKDNYDNYYAGQPSEWRRIGAAAKADNISRLCINLPRRTVLEIGAGEGAILQRLADMQFGDALYALEISQSGVDAIRLRQIHRLAECRLFDGYHIPYEDNRFDIANLSHVIEHVEHPRQLIYEAARVARYVLIEVPLEDTLLLSKDFVFDSVGHINYYSPVTLRRLIQSCGLRVLDQVTTNRSRASYVFQAGRKGVIRYQIKQLFLSALPYLATKVFVYHGTLVCTRKTDIESG